MKIADRAALVSKSWAKSQRVEVREEIMVMREQTGGRSARSGHQGTRRGHDGFPSATVRRTEKGSKEEEEEERE